MSMSNGQEAGRVQPANVLWTIPNVLSLMRGLAGPAVLALITSDLSGGLAAALILMLLAEFSDFIDGEIARRFGQESELGRLIDPVADSVYHLSVFLAFLAMGWMAAWMLFIIYARDLVVPYLRTFARQSGHDLTVRASGKIKTAVHAAAQIGIVAIALGLAGDAVTIDGPVPTVLLLAAIGASLYSLMDYFGEVARLVKS